jgi:hypothetical protein
MAPPGITIIKSFAYRGGTEEWSNQYHLSDNGSDPAAWRAIVDDAIALEQPVVSDHVTFLRALCYDDTDSDSVYTYDLADFAGTVLGTLVSGALYPLSGDDACWVRWDTGRRSSTGKKIYLRKYFHDVWYEDAAHRDYVASAQRTALQALGDGMLTAFSGSVSMVGPDGNVPPGPAATSPYVTTRTLKRRGRRP